jgi:hypothetical protein
MAKIGHGLRQGRTPDTIWAAAAEGPSSRESLSPVDIPAQRPQILPLHHRSALISPYFQV